jgi:hypothetical protein
VGAVVAATVPVACALGALVEVAAGAIVVFGVGVALFFELPQATLSIPPTRRIRRIVRPNLAGRM